MTMTDNEQCREASPEECQRLIGEGCRVIDVRTPAEFGEGHLEGAVNIDFYAPNFRERLDTLERDRTYVIYCKKGGRGAKAMDLMRQAGFSRIYNVSGGYDTWCARGLPVQR